MTTLTIRNKDQERAGRVLLAVLADDNDSAVRTMIEAGDEGSVVPLVIALARYGCDLARSISGDDAEALMIKALIDLSNETEGQQHDDN